MKSPPTQEHPVLLMIEQASSFQHFLRTGAASELIRRRIPVAVACMPGCEPDHAAQAAHPGMEHHVIHPKKRGGLRGISRFLDKICHALERDLLILDAPDCTLAQNRRHYQRKRGTNPQMRILYARLLHSIGLRWRLFSRLAENWGSYPEFAALLDRLQPRAVVYCNCMVGQFDCLREARRRRIPVILDLQNWDQATTKGPLSVIPDAALLWSEEIKRDFCQIHSFPESLTHTIGCVNFDVYFNPPKPTPRDVFCQRYRIDPSSKIVLYAFGNLQGLDMFDPIVRELHEIVRDGRLGFPVHLLVRASPSVALPPERESRPGLSYQKPLSRCRNGSKQWIPDEGEEAERYSTLYHADVCVNAFSTMILDSGCVGTPVINMGYAMVDGQENTRVIDRFLDYTHLRILNEPGVTAIPRSRQELRESLALFLRHSSAHAEQRQYLLKTICGYTDANSHRRWADAVQQISRRTRER